MLSHLKVILFHVFIFEFFPLCMDVLVAKSKHFLYSIRHFLCEIVRRTCSYEDLKAPLLFQLCIDCRLLYQVGVLPMDESKVTMKGRLGPGMMITADLQTGQVRFEFLADFNFCIQSRVARFCL